MSNNILVSEKWGVNPCMPLCVFCGEPTGVIALLGKLSRKRAEALRLDIPESEGKFDLEAPRHMPGPFVPCDACKEKWITLCEATQAPDGSPSPTGRFVQISEDAYRGNFVNYGDDGAIDLGIKNRMCWIEPDAYEMVAGAIEATIQKAKGGANA